MEISSKSEKTVSFLLRFVRVMIVLIIAGGFATLLIALKKEPEKKEIILSPPSVKVIVATPVTRVMTVDAFGTVKPRKLVKIVAEVPGRIDYLHSSFIEGGMIHKDQLVVGIDQRSYTLEKQAADVRIRQALTDIESLNQDIENLKNDIELSRANEDLAKKELMRITALHENQFASRNSLDKVEQQYLQARIALQNINNRLSMTGTLMEQKKAALAMARVDSRKADLALEKTHIKSEFDGFVLEKFAEIGEYVNPGQPLGSMYQKGKLDVDVSIPLEKMEWIKSFFENRGTPQARVMVANTDYIGPQIWDARVARIKAKIDEKTRTLPMTLEIFSAEEEPSEIFDLKPGTFVKCIIAGETFENIFVLPRHLLNPDNRLFMVVDNHLEIKTVNVLRKFEEEIFINAGINPGDKIISSPLPGAREGMALAVKQNGD